jgi:glycosidase
MRLRLLALLASSLAAGSLAAAALPSCTPDTLTGAPDGGAGGAGGGACTTTDSPCPVTFHLPLTGQKSVELRGDFQPGAWTMGVPLSIDGGEWRTTIGVKNNTPIHYKFFVDGMTWITDPANQASDMDGNSVTTASCPITGGPDCGKPDAGVDAGPPPIVGSYDWRQSVMYFAFIDRFDNGDPSNDAPVSGIEGPANYQGGDYAGLLAKITEGYFDKLGVNTLWLTVPMDNPSVAGAGSDGHPYSAYHGYWPSNLDKVEEHFGTLALLKQLVDAAHKKGIKVLFDYAMNHVHESSPTYKDHPDWFWPLDYNGKYCVCGQGCDWNDSYEQKRCWFTPYLPDWNFTVTEARAFSVSNAVKWITDTGIDGFRLDAVKHIETVWISDLRTRVTNEIEPASKQHFYMVGETFESGNRDLVRKYVDPSLLDGQFDFPLRAVVVEKLLRRSGSMFDLDGFLASNDGYYPGIMSTFLGNHDIARIINTAMDDPWDAWAAADKGYSNWGNTPQLPTMKSPFERLAVAFTFLLTTKGIPLIYYGDEIGMPGAGDPDNRRFMQWTGYSDNQLFLRGQIEKLGQIRKAHPALWRGTRTTASVTQDTYGYVMTDGADVVSIALNRGDSAAAVAGMPAKGHDLLTDTDISGPSVTLPPRTAMVLVAK